MSKKVLILSSSPRRGGNSDVLCGKFQEGAESAGNEVKKVFLKDKKINYCSGCGLCNSNGYSGCSQNDDMIEILEDIISSDVIVMASPVYFYAMSGQMKTLIDRCCAKYTKIKNKDFYFILTAADSNKGALERTVEEFRGFLDCLSDVNEKEIIYGTGLWQKNDVIGTSYIEQALKTGKNI